MPEKPASPGPQTPTQAVDSTADLILRAGAGEMVRSLGGGTYAPGRHQLQWDGRSESGNPLAPGVYLYRLEVTGAEAGPKLATTRRMTLLK